MLSRLMLTGSLSSSRKSNSDRTENGSHNQCEHNPHHHLWDYCQLKELAPERQIREFRRYCVVVRMPVTSECEIHNNQNRYSSCITICQKDLGQCTPSQEGHHPSRSYQQQSDDNLSWKFCFHSKPEPSTSNRYDQP